VAEIGVQMSQTRKEKYGGVHFFDAVAVKLVEIIKTAETSDETLHKINEWSQFIGKVPISCKDTPGFIVNRLNIPYFMEAVRMFERGNYLKCMAKLLTTQFRTGNSTERRKVHV
jgi:3-hydroxyacyl-CoA dehydrogenase